MEKINYKNKPNVLRGVSPEDCLIFKGDPDIGIFNLATEEEIRKVYEACKPTLPTSLGKIMIFGTGGDNNFFIDSYKI